MASEDGGERREISPWLNLFWLVLFLPITWILRLLWKKKVPWLNGPPDWPTH